MAAEMSRTTLNLPTELPREMDRVVQEGKARSRSELVAAAVRRELAVRERAAIEAEFERADVEALRLAGAEE